ncbi:acyl carrier protein [Stenotrophomonas indicatrix]|uniref:acyl carrier protein n=2 Tax=Lysobacteraceae TaxID=32033 RepID=UPI0028A0EB25|nr:acyl carrier protein [Stenotrophomonas indicatrix]
MTKNELFERIVRILTDSFEIEPARISPESRLYDDLDIDSIDAVDLIVQLKPLLGRNLKRSRPCAPCRTSLMLCMACCPVRPLPDSSTDAATMARARMVVVAAISLAYPVLVYAAMGRFEPRWLALLLFALALLRALSTRQPLWWAAAAGAGLLAGLATVLNQALPLKLYPALVNVVMLTVFATSLRFGPPLVERLARLQEPDLPPFAVIYTRRVTQVWCGFFVLNGGLALLTALYASDRVWMLYNGLLAYVMMGLLFGGEWLVRRRVKAAHAHG